MEMYQNIVLLGRVNTWLMAGCDLDDTGRKVLLNDALAHFIYGYMVKHPSGQRSPTPHGLLDELAAFMCTNPRTG